MTTQSLCLYCKLPLLGRSDKKYCDPYCKSAHQYQKRKSLPETFYKTVSNQLNTNRKLLKQFNKAGKSIVRAALLLDEGFSPNFFTHLWRNRSGEIYFFVFEYGFLIKKENGKEKYVLVTWQDYMRPNRP